MTLTANKSCVTLLKNKEYLKFVVSSGTLHLQRPLQGMPFLRLYSGPAPFHPSNPPPKKLPWLSSPAHQQQTHPGYYLPVIPLYLPPLLPKPTEKQQGTTGYGPRELQWQMGKPKPVSLHAGSQASLLSKVRKNYTAEAAHWSPY